MLRIYDGGNMGMQRRRVHGVIVEESFNPRAIMDDDFVKFEKSMEAIGTVADPLSKSRGIMQAAESVDDGTKAALIRERPSNLSEHDPVDPRAPAVPVPATATPRAT